MRSDQQDLLPAFRRELQAVREARAKLEPSSHEARMHLGFRITALVDALTALVEHAVSGRSLSRTDLAAHVSASALVPLAEAAVLTRWLLRHHAVSVFVLEATCLRWSQEIQDDAPALEAVAVRLSGLAQADGAAVAR